MISIQAVPEIESLPNVLAILPGITPSTLLCVVRPLSRLRDERRIRFLVTQLHLLKKEDLDNVHLIVFCRNCDPFEVGLLREIIQRGIPYIYVLDDNLFRVPAGTRDGNHHGNPSRIYTLQEYLRNADLVRVHSPVLVDEIQAYNTNVRLVGSYFDFAPIEQVDLLPKNKIRIVYATSRTDDPVQEVFTEAVSKICKEYANQVEMIFWGAAPRSLDLLTLSNVTHFPPDMDYEKFLQEFRKQNFDIGLAPLLDDPFHNSKTNNKYREYGGCKIAGIYSDAPLYRNYIQSRQNGILLSNSPQEWYLALKLLIENRELREAIQEKAYREIRKKYSLESHIQEWEGHINQVLGKHLTQSAQPKKRSLPVFPARLTFVRAFQDHESPVLHQFEKNLRNFYETGNTRIQDENVYSAFLNFFTWKPKSYFVFADDVKQARQKLIKIQRKPNSKVILCSSNHEVLNQEFKGFCTFKKVLLTDENRVSQDVIRMNVTRSFYSSFEENPYLFLHQQLAFKREFFF
jgi:glycosyltransferase involved in cell wall biosynthesis